MCRPMRRSDFIAFKIIEEVLIMIFVQNRSQDFGDMKGCENIAES